MSAKTEPGKTVDSDQPYASESVGDPAPAPSVVEAVQRQVADLAADQASNESEEQA